ncbi:DUF6234 family protein [Streptomyces sp. NPDC001315]|uniref:DUF6234 family protein n=1 Tax=Streptomyces sp. NPDC001315 TaxID=3364562 RepID=UPI0036C4E8D0
MTTAPTPPTPRRDHLHPVADVFLAVVLLAVDAGAALRAYLAGLEAAGYEFFDTGADNSGVSMTESGVYVAVVGVVVPATAVAAGRGRAYFTALGQILAGLALLLVAAVALTGSQGS